MALTSPQINELYHDLEQQVRELIKPHLPYVPTDDHVCTWVQLVPPLQQELLIEQVKPTCKEIIRLRKMVLEEFGNYLGHLRYLEQYNWIFVDWKKAKEGQEERERREREALEADPWYNK